MDVEFFSITSDNGVRKSADIEGSVELDNLIILDECKNVLFQGRIERLRRILRHGELANPITT
jgi:hypothetical protein